MIARTWRGWAPRATAADYQHHYETEVAEHLRQVAGFRAFAGDDPEQAVVEEAARRALSRWDDRVIHDEVAVDRPG